MSDPNYPDVGRPRGHPASRQPAGELGPPRDFIAQSACPGDGCRLWAGHGGPCANQNTLYRDQWHWADGDYAIDADGRHWQLRLDAQKNRRRYYRTNWHWHLLSAGADRPTVQPRSPLQPAKLVPDI